MIPDAAAEPAPEPNAATAASGGRTPDPLALTALHEILSALAHDTPADAVFGLVAQKAALLTGAASAVLALLEPSREELTFAAVAGDEGEELSGARVLASDTVVGHTARTGEPYLTVRAAPAPASGTHHSSASPPVSSAAVVPVFVGGAPAGALGALNKANGRPFDGGDMLALSALSAAVSATLVGSQRRDESQRQSRELSVLYDAVRSVAGNLSMQDVLRAVIRQVAAHIDCSAAAVFLLNDERTHLYVAEDDRLSDEERERMLPADAGLGGAALGTSRPLFLSFPGPDDEPGGLPAAHDSPFPERGARSGLAVAIRSGETEHGMLLVLSGQAPGSFTLADANLLSALAAQAAVAIENAYLFEDATRRAEEAAALYELSQAVTSTLRLEDVLERVADSVLSLLSVDKFALFLRERDGADRLRLEIGRGLADGAAERLRPLVGQGIPGWVVEFETPTGVQDVAADHRNGSAPLHTEGVVSLACMPLQVGTEAIGVLCAMSSRRRLFTIAEMELLYTIANQASVAIENARVYEDVRQKSRELRKYFHRVGRALGSAQSPEQVPHLIASLTLEVMGADRCALHELRIPEDGSGSPHLVLAARAGFRLAEEPEGSGRGTPGTPEPEPLPLADNCPAGLVARRARALAVEDTAEEPRLDPRYLRPARGKAASYLGVPLRSGKDVVGVLEVFSRTRRVWRGDDMRLLLTFASQATVAFQNARLASERREASREARLLRRLVTLVARGEATPPAVVAAVYEESGLPAAAYRLDASGAPDVLLARAGETDAAEKVTAPAGLLCSARSADGAVEIACFLPSAGTPAPPLSAATLEAVASVLAAEPARPFPASQ